MAVWAAQETAKISKYTYNHIFAAIFMYIYFVLQIKKKQKTQRIWNTKQVKKGEVDVSGVSGGGRVEVGVEACGRGFGDGGLADLVAGLSLSLVLCWVRCQTQVEPRTLTWGQTHNNITHSSLYFFFLWGHSLT